MLKSIQEVAGAQCVMPQIWAFVMPHFCGLLTVRPLMNASATAYIAEATLLAEAEAANLLSISYSEAAGLPESRTRSLQIAGARASGTIFRQLDAFRLKGTVLVVVQVARHLWLGGSDHIERGLVFAPDGLVRPAT